MRSNYRKKVLYKYLFKFFKKTVILQTCKLVKFGSKTTADEASFIKKIILINVLPQSYVNFMTEKFVKLRNKIPLVTLRK